MWNSLKSTPPDLLADLEVRKQSLADQGAKEVRCAKLTAQHS